jgi:hypothetical protein
MARRKGQKDKQWIIIYYTENIRLSNTDPTRKPKVHSGVQEGWGYW